jgi:hypothetical protein
VRTVWNVLRDVPHMGLRAGDVVVVDTACAVPICLMRSLPPNFGAVLLADLDGAIEPADISPASPAGLALPPAGAPSGSSLRS